MNIKTNISKEIRLVEKEVNRELRKLERDIASEVAHNLSKMQRTFAVVLAIATLFSVSELGHMLGHDKREAVAIPYRGIISKTTERNDTVRMPIKFDDGLRATATASE